MPMIVMTTSSSTSVNARGRDGKGPTMTVMRNPGAVASPCRAHAERTRKRRPDKRGKRGYSNDNFTASAPRRKPHVTRW